jgi:hypothetical protein
MKNRQLERDVSKVSDAIGQAFAAGGALLILLAGTHTMVQHAVCDRGPLSILKQG